MFILSLKNTNHWSDEEDDDGGDDSDGGGGGGDAGGDEGDHSFALHSSCSDCLGEGDEGYFLHNFHDDDVDCGVRLSVNLKSFAAE